MSFPLTNNDGQITIKGRAGDKATYSAEHDVANVRFAVSRSWPSEDSDAVNGFKSVTAWFKAAAWKNNAQAAAQVEKGDVIEVQFHAADLQAEGYTRTDGSIGAGLKIARCRIRVLAAKSGAPVEFEAEETEAEPEGEIAL